MAVYKKSKGTIKQGGIPTVKACFGGNPDSIYGFHPSWNFIDCDIDEKIPWSFSKSRLLTEFWDVIFPKLREYESMTWAQILIDSKKQNHSIPPNELNKCARDRLIELHIEAESIYTLRFGGSLRIYGFLSGASYHILWYDDSHGDNNTCVCRSYLKHT